MSVQIVNFRPSGDQEWAQWAECAKLGSPGMYPSDQDTQGIEWAKNTCLACPVRTECLTVALQRGEQWGVWGGLTTDERNTLRRQDARVSSKTGKPRTNAAELADAVLRAELDGAA